MANAKPSVYDPIPLSDQLVADALDIGLVGSGAPFYKYDRFLRLHFKVHRSISLLILAKLIIGAREDRV